MLLQRTDPVFDRQLPSWQARAVTKVLCPHCLKESAVKTVGDDGISQEITVKSGIAAVKNVQLPNPVVLRPYRTFNEVAQPASAFIFRAQDGPKFALIEADNGAWEGVAMKAIKEFMEFEVPGLNVIA